jgi:hypothetical protein
VQSYLFANLVNIFQFPIAGLSQKGDKWALYSFILAIVVSIGYGVVSYTSSEVSAVLIPSVVFLSPVVFHAYQDLADCDDVVYFPKIPTRIL